MSESLYGAGTPKSKTRAKRWRSLLQEDRIDAILSRAKTERPSEMAAPEAAEKEIAYFEKNRQRMLYASFRAKGFFIGSGIVEAGCKTVVGKRVKNSGMFWTVAGPGTSSPSALPCSAATSTPTGRPAHASPHDPPQLSCHTNVHLFSYFCLGQGDTAVSAVMSEPHRRDACAP